MTTPTAASNLALLSRWIDDHPANAARDPEARLWGRVAKVSEEAGEAIAALITYTGQNPRKPAVDDVGPLIGELLDVAVTALGAVEHVARTHGVEVDPLGLLEDKLANLVERAGLELPA